uniref:RecQ-mediated genome instability protein 1 n=1 Tax=Panagrolaimus superbus TaxID=310955 RepID=A0A914YHI3_9BILA
MNEIANVRAFFNERHITLNSEWEDDAIGYVKAQLRNGDDILKLSKSVFVQWLNSDLRESTQPTLNVPANATGITVVKPALVQLTSILNISESAYSQYRSKIMDLTEDNSEFRDPSETSHEQVEKPKYGNIQPKKPPMYMYKLSDGNITLKAVIAETINGLDCNTPIGAKLLLIPKFLCRYRVLKLTSQNCQFLGGYNEQCIDKDDPLSKLLNRIENTENRQPPLISQP